MGHFGKCFRTSKIPNREVSDNEQTARIEKELHEKSVDIITEPFLPRDIIAEVLSWLPVKCLAKSKCVCKEWYAITRIRCFIEKHMARARPPRLLHNIVSLRTPTPEDDLKETFELICGCDGLLVEKNNLAPHKYRIRNQTTNRMMDLPDMREGNFCMTFSFVPSMDQYKVVCVCDDKEKTGSEGWEVLTLGIDNSDPSWRSLNLPDMDDLNNKRERSSLVSAGLAVHYVVTIKSGSNSYILVVSLDLETECFTSLSLPEGRFSDMAKVYAIDWNGLLSFIQMTEVGLDVLVLEDYKKHKWGERTIVVQLRNPPGRSVVFQNVIPLLAKSGILYFQLKDGTYYLYNMGSKKWIIVNAPEGYSFDGAFYVVPPSLVTLKGMK